MSIHSVEDCQGMVNTIRYDLSLLNMRKHQAGRRPVGARFIQLRIELAYWEPLLKTAKLMELITPTGTPEL